MTRRRKAAWALLIGCLVFLATVIGYFGFYTSRIAGTYIARGGLGHIEILRTGPFTWSVDRQTFFPYGRVRIGEIWPYLQLELTVDPTASALPPGEPEPYVIFDLRPSRSIKGGWDIRGGNLHNDPFKKPSQPEGWFGRVRHWFFGDKGRSMRAKRSLPFLYRFNDERVARHFILLNEDEATTAAFEVARSLLADYPDDEHIRALYLTAAAKCDDFEEVGRRLNEWETSQEDLVSYYVWNVFLSLETWHRSRQLSAKDLNAYDVCRRAFGPESDLATRHRLLPEIWKCEAYLHPMLPDVGNAVMADMLNTQVALKTVCVSAMLNLIEGNREEALELLTSAYRMGQLVSEEGYMLQRLLGFAYSAIAAGHLKIYALNAAETKEDFLQLWEALQRLEEKQNPNRLNNIREADPRLYFEMDNGTWTSNLEEAETRKDASDSWFELVRMATAARYRLATTGEFPKAAEEFGPLLPDGPPKDPFGDGRLMFNTAPDLITCYSIGPDRVDDGGVIVYDPTNGTVSRGDRVLEVPRRRKYPFPRVGVTANSVEDLRQLFPNGLPPDPFASNKGRGLSPAVAGDGQLFLFSFGPDVDEYKTPNPLTFNSIIATGTVLRPSEIPSGRTVDPHRLQVPYDPTNGIISPGDLYIPIPRR